MTLSIPFDKRLFNCVTLTRNSEVTRAKFLLYASKLQKICLFWLCCFNMQFLMKYVCCCCCYHLMLFCFCCNVCRLLAAAVAISTFTKFKACNFRRADVLYGTVSCWACYSFSMLSVLCISFA